MKGISIFISYSHRDEKFREELVSHLASLQRAGIVRAWHDRCLQAGETWAEQIDENIERADVILLLISSDFLASEYCYERELDRALERHRQGLATVIPVVIRSVVWEHLPIHALQALPRDARPVEEWKYRDRAWADVVRGILEASQGEFGRADQGRALARECRSRFGLPAEKTPELDALDTDESAAENVVEEWEDTKKIAAELPVLATRLAEYRRDAKVLEALKQEQHRAVMSLTNSGLPIEIITFLTMVKLLENLEERIKVRTKELEVLQLIEDAKKERPAVFLELSLYPESLGLSVNHTTLAQHYLHAEMKQYKETLEGLPTVAGLIKKEILEPLRRLS